MTPARWQQIEELYHAALECEPGERAAFLARTDPELRREVESLLAQQSGATPLDRPPWDGASSLLETTIATLTPGTQLGPYKIEGPLAAGGMGEVFRGVDTRLGRSVAVKTSREQFSERFNREARAISALNHPNICTLYDVGPNYLVMELCEGETLAARLKRGKLSINDTLRYGQQIADALAAAHAKGIVHRDLKPGNIMLGKTGVKVLDFGLAKSLQDETLTGARMVMGTPAYMAPEQREGKECDARTDIYSLGLVLHEMATGKRAEQSQIPSLDTLPPHLAQVIERCLAPDTDERWQSAHDVRALLGWSRSKPTSMPERTQRSQLSWGIAAVATLVAVVITVLHFRGTPADSPDQHPLRFLVSPPEKLALVDEAAVISPDGASLVYGAIDSDGKTRLWIRPLSSLAAEPVVGSEGARTGFWSPDSRSIGFFAGGKLKRSDLNGGPAQVLCDASESGRPMGAWSRNGVILFSDEKHQELWAVPAVGGQPRPITDWNASRKDLYHAYPKFLPDGRHFVYLVQSAVPKNTGIYAGSLDAKVNKQLLNISGNPSYAESSTGQGYLLFMQGSTLMAQAFDAGRLEVFGERFPVAEQVLLPPANQPGFGAYSVSKNGVLAYRTLDQATTELVWFDREGRRLRSVGEPANYSNPALSPDEKRIVVARFDLQVGARDLWLMSVPQGAPSRFTFDPADETNPLWSPSGDRIAFSSRTRGTLQIYQKAVTGTQQAEPLLDSSDVSITQSWTPDGRFILYNSGGDIWMLPLKDHRKPVLLVAGTRNGPAVSPNMKWLAYQQANDSGRNEIFVKNFPPAGGQWQVSKNGGEEPYWRKDGKEMFYLEGRRLMAVEVQSDGPIFQYGIPKALFDLRREVVDRRSRYQVAANGGRFLINMPLESNSAAAITVVTNWTASLKKP
jgi:serine/threonine protein kinase